MNDGIEGKAFLVTGGAGSIGSSIVEQLLAHKAGKVIVLSRDEIKHFLMKSRIPDLALETVVCDVRDYHGLERIFNRYHIDAIFHAAAMKHVVVSEHFPIECARTNIIGTQNLVDLAVKYRVPKCITISTDKATSPSNVMGATKFIAEKITLNANYSCVRFGNVANSRGSVIPVLIDNLAQGKPLTITDTGVTRFIMGIPDAVKLVIRASQHARGGEIFILKMKAFRLGDLLDVILEDIVPALNMRREDVRIDTIGLTTGEKLHEDLINVTEIDRLYEFEGMFVIRGEHASGAGYPSMKKIRLENYSSNDVALITKEEIRNYVRDYLRTTKGIPFDEGRVRTRGEGGKGKQ